MEKNVMISKIVDIEWEMFQSVDSLGGRASCQDDRETFDIMRISQYANWTDEMITCYLEFLEKSKEEKRNLVSEKYGRMMAYTDMHYYNKYIRDNVPLVSQEAYRLINTIVDSLIKWEKELSQKYPKLAGTARPVTSDADEGGFTSMETYARGELETYPVELLRMYSEYIQKLSEEGKSLAEMNQLTMVNLYGYDTIQDAEDSL